MELREFAERILFADNLEEKLAPPALLTDEQPGQPISAPVAPGRPAELRFKSQHGKSTRFPNLHQIDQPEERGRLLHFFANHELLATELMALVLLRFPEAPRAFRRTVLQTLKDEQEHTRWYLRRMEECGVMFGQLPVSGYFWRAIADMASPVDYVARLSLTFEQANLDFASFFSRGFAEAGDQETSALLRRIYQDEIGHVASGLSWFRKWKNPEQSDWDAFRNQLRFPLSAQRAKGPSFNEEGRRAAGLDPQFIEQLRVFAQSKGRTPAVFVFNPFAEERIARGAAFTPNRRQEQLRRDLENLPQFLCRRDDVVLVGRRPAVGFLNRLSEAGFAVPEFVEITPAGIDPAGDLCRRKISRLRPWAWAPDSVELLRPLFPNLTAANRNPETYFNDKIARVYSKDFGLKLLLKLLDRHRTTAQANWLCGDFEAGFEASTFSEAMARIAEIRAQGHHAVVIKKALGLAGQNALRLLEPDLLESQKRWIQLATEQGQTLMVEPWLDRVADFSVQLERESSGLKQAGYTTLLTDWKGHYQGNRATPGYRQTPGLDLPALFPNVSHVAQQMRDLYAGLFELLEQQLAETGYVGPLGIDAFVYRAPGGHCRLKPVVEINPRYTMGRFTLELMGKVLPGSTGTLRLLSLKTVQSESENFSAWATLASQRAPIRTAGEPIPRIQEGIVSLGDPEQAEICLPIFEVTKASTSSQKS